MKATKVDSIRKLRVAELKRINKHRESRGEIILGPKDATGRTHESAKSGDSYTIFLKQVAQCETALVRRCFIGISSKIQSHPCEQPALYTWTGDRRVLVTKDWIVSQLSHCVSWGFSDADRDGPDVDLISYEYLLRIAQKILDRVPEHHHDWPMPGGISSRYGHCESDVCEHRCV